MVTAETNPRTLKSECKAIYVLEEKKSKFICHLLPVESETAARVHISNLSREYHDASHNCFAYIVNDGFLKERFSDDGEPAGTAGMPMLKVLQGAGLRNVLAVVTRYFGGTLLGTGGLRRAYVKAVSEGIAHADTEEIKDLKQIVLSCGYHEFNRLAQVIKEYAEGEPEIRFLEEVTAVFRVDSRNTAAFAKKIAEAPCSVSIS